ncbi:hypothetical protein BH09BAC6_BH09BAC6_02980 [soil metagenome]|jgi:hypothetical protein
MPIFELESVKAVYYCVTKKLQSSANIKIILQIGHLLSNNTVTGPLQPILSKRYIFIIPVVNNYRSSSKVFMFDFNNYEKNTLL